VETILLTTLLLENGLVHLANLIIDRSVLSKTFFQFEDVLIRYQERFPYLIRGNQKTDYLSLLIIEG